MPYLTPNTLPADTICRVLFIPNDEQLIANVTGAIQMLTFDWNWTPFGSVTPEDAANAMVPMFDKFSFNQRGCHMVAEVILWAGANDPPENFLLCDGTHYSDADYPDLWAAIGTTYGGTGASDFAVPDLRGSVPIGASAGHAVGSSGGAETVTLSVAEIPAHNHTTVPHSHSEVTAVPSVAELPVVPVPAAVPGVGITGLSGVTVDNTGGGGAHNNMQPFVTMRYYIQAR